MENIKDFVENITDGDAPESVENNLKESNLLVYKVKEFTLKDKKDHVAVMRSVMEELFNVLEEEAPGCQGGIVVIPHEDFMGGSVILYVDEEEFNSKKNKDKPEPKPKNKRKKSQK